VSFKICELRSWSRETWFLKTEEAGEKGERERGLLWGRMMEPRVGLGFFLVVAFYP
jgi:hypothetical protein